MKQNFLCLLLLVEVSSLSRAADNVIDINAYMPHYLDGDKYSYRAALDTGLQLLREKKDILPNHTIQIHYTDDGVRI